MRFGPPGISLSEGEFFDFPVQRPRGDTQRRRSFRLIAIGLTKRILDKVSLTLLDVADGSVPISSRRPVA